MHARLELINVTGRCKMELLGLQDTEESSNH